MDLEDLKKRAALRFGVPEPKPCSNCGKRFYMQDADVFYGGYRWVPSCNCSNNKPSQLFAHYKDEVCHCPQCNQTLETHNNKTCPCRLTGPKHWTIINPRPIIVDLRVTIIID